MENIEKCTIKVQLLQLLLMSKRKFALLFCACPSIIILVGCADMTAVRDFAKQSAALSSGTEAVQYWASWDQRSKNLLSMTKGLPNAVSPAQPTDPFNTTLPIDTKEAKDSVLGLHGALTAYMSALGDLASDKLPDVSTQVDKLVANVNKFPMPNSEGVTAEQAQKKREGINAAYGSILKLLRLPLLAYQNKKVKEFVLDNDEHIQRIIEGLILSSRAFTEFFAAERRTVENWYVMNNSLYPATPSFLNNLQSTEQKEKLLKSYDDKKKALTDYSLALKLIGEEHKKLANGIGNFNTATMQRTIGSLVDAKDQIIKARNEYEKAFSE